jgi:hypothetical protein
VTAPERVKRVRVTLDLELPDYAALNRWVAAVNLAVDPGGPRLTLSAVLRAMIRATVADTPAGPAVVDELRSGRR